MATEDFFNNPSFNLSAKGITKAFNSFAYNSNYYDPRTLIIGDSHLQMGWGNNSGNLFGFTVTNGIATLTFYGNHYVTPGNKFTLVDVTNNSTFDTCTMSYAEITAITVPTSSTLTCSATVNGITMDDGNYMTGRTWLVIPWTNQKDSTFLHWINAFNGAPFVFTHIFTINGSSSAQHLACLSKLQAQALKSSYSNLVISLGTNSPMFQQATLATAIAGAETEYKNIMAIADALYSKGTVYITIPMGGSTGTSNPANFTRAVGYLRRKLLQVRRPYRLRFFDLLGMSVDGTSSTGLLMSNYQGAQNHLSTFANFKIAKQETAWDSRLGWDTASRMIWKPVSYLDDNTNVVTAWAGSGTSYSVGNIRMNNYNIYECTVAGTGATSGGPTGEGTNIIDNTVRWNYLGPAPVNLIRNGLMQGTTGTLTAAFTGSPATVPTGWSLSSATNVTLASSTTQGGSTITAGAGKPSLLEALPGFGWDLSVVYSAAGSIALYQNCPLNLKPGNWYQARFTVTGKTALNTVLEAIELTIQAAFTGVGLFQVTTMQKGNNATNIPLDTTDSYEIITQPFYVPNTLSTSTDNQVTINIKSSGAGSVNLQLSNFVYCPIRDPNLYPIIS